MKSADENSAYLLRRVDEHFAGIHALVERMRSETAGEVVRAAGLLHQAVASGRKVLVCGNGGSAAEAQHFAAELVGRFLIERDPLPAVALSTDTSVLTALGNDYGYEQVFARQVQALGNAGDVLLALSTSGRSPNIAAALSEAARQNLKTIALVGRELPPELPPCDIVITVPHPETPRIQEMHLAMLHMICDLIDAVLFEEQ